jgi:hypothetical protein
MVQEGNHLIASLSNQDAMLLGVVALSVLGTLLLATAIFNLFFVLSIRKTLKMIPEKYHVFSPVLLWLMIIPGIGYIFEWIMLPFGVPRTIEAFFGEGEKTKEQPHARFFGLGLATVIVELGIFTPFMGVASLVLKIIYWSYAVGLRHQIQARLQES